MSLTFVKIVQFNGISSCFGLLYQKAGIMEAVKCIFIALAHSVWRPFSVFFVQN